MGGGGPINVQRVSALRVSEYHGGLTWQVILVAAIGASGGLLFGYDNGIIGGVMAFEQFEEKFFPDVYAKKNSPEVVNNTNPYCAYENEKLQLFASSFFLAGMVSSLFGAKVSRAFGRRITMIIGSICFIVGSVLCAFAKNIAMLCIGRVFLGWGVGMVNQVAPLYLSEMAPYKYRGALNVCFQWSITIGILVAQLINYGVQDMNNGWQLSLGLAGSPALVLLIGSILLPETPNSLIERGHHEKGRKVLATVRGTQAVDAEYEDIVEAVRLAEGIRMRDSWRMLFTRRFTPQLVNTIMINMFQQFSGINAIIFYVPVLFSSLGSGKSAALLNTVIIGAVNVGSTFVSVLTVDKFGRKFLLIEGGIQTAITQLIVGVVLGVEFSAVGGNVLPKSVSIGVLVVICVYIAGFAWSWGPLGWLVPSEIFTLETRPAGTATAVFSNFLFTFIIGQTFLTMLCSMHWGVFIFFCGFLIMAVLWVIFFLPETMRLPVERVEVVFAKHWFWRKVMGPAGEDAIRRDEERMATRKAGMLETAGDYAEPGSPGPKDAASPKVGPSPGGTTVTREQ